MIEDAREVGPDPKTRESKLRRIVLLRSELRGGHPKRLRILTLIFAALLSGCADFKAVSVFATQTTKMTTAVKSEFTQLEALCTEQAGLVLIVNNITDDRPLNDCEQYKKAQGQLAAVTVDVLDGYAKALAGLADDKPFDLSSDIKGVGGKLQALKDSDGKALLSAKEAGALTKIADVLVDVLASAKREEAIRRMVDESPDLAITGNLLKSFFVRSPSAPDSAAKTPYTNLVNLLSSSVTSTQIILSNDAMRKAEPIRTAELLREVRTRRQFLEKRDVNKADAVPTRIAAAIDAWLGALEKFSTDALLRDPKELLEQLKDLRDKANAARDAVASK